MKTFLIALFVLSVGAFAQDEDDIRIMKMMNDLRKEQGAKPLKFHPKLDSLAIEWAKHIQYNIKDIEDSKVHENQRNDPMYLHFNLSGRAFMAGLINGFTITKIGENVAFSSGGVPNDVVGLSFNSWKNSPSHYEAIVDKFYTHAAFYHIVDSNKRIVYITVFARVL